MLRAVLLLIFAAASVYAGCDNACSGHGTCSIKGVCQCYDNFGIGLSHDSGDCSDRICPYEISWVDTPDKLGKHHKYSECAGAGICDRTTGECACFPGHEGKGCVRSTCPNSCSGHGQCTYIEDLPYGAVANDYNSTYFNYAPQSSQTFDYYNWDTKKSRACVCDPEWGEVDCSSRMCPYATDVMDVRNNLLVAGKYQVQQVILAPDNGAAYTTMSGKTIALTFKSKLNESFVTRPLLIDSSLSGINAFALDVQYELMRLPNSVIDKVQVSGSILYNALHLNITFSGNAVQGPQHLLTVKDISCGDGCTPQLVAPLLVHGTRKVTELQSSDYNSYECGRRGKCDYTAGVCGCFAGYTGVACNVITALV